MQSQVIVSAGKGVAHLPMPRKDMQPLQRAQSDTSAFLLRESDMIKCECCGMEEDCTPTYISKIRELFSGKWICGLCAEAVKELLTKDPSISKETALEAHMAMCKKFNSTIRLNPNFYLASAMKDVAKKCLNRRRSLDSCVPVAAKIEGGGAVSIVADMKKK
ncbi:DUF1677 family protein (DUF1677) [Rhynchospora pubera]|uniref:DUF1677 family protein (DUF1677) n=2 Tax=Rhynchospora pubera TaxID=906938 RepID=A0AAV8FZE9_9POAL|nr:DUF1677 family protein (DUF1677) [Rhynchospora pubera]